MTGISGGWYQQPNEIADTWAENISPTAILIGYYITRHTIGYHKEYAAISYEQFIYGHFSKERKQLDYGCGISNRNALSRGLKELAEKGKISTIIIKHQTYYKVNSRNCSQSEVNESEDTSVSVSIPKSEAVEDTSVSVSIPKSVSVSIPKSVSVSIPKSARYKDNERKNKNNNSFFVPSSLKEQVAQFYCSLDAFAQKKLNPEYTFTPDSDSDESICSLLSQLTPAPGELEQVCSTMWSNPFWQDKFTVKNICKQYKSMSLKLSSQRYKASTKQQDTYELEVETEPVVTSFVPNRPRRRSIGA